MKYSQVYMRLNRKSENTLTAVRTHEPDGAIVMLYRLSQVLNVVNITKSK